MFAAGYFRQGEGTPPGLLCLEYHLFLASMVLVVLADDAYAFMVMWETMALSSYFLVTANHRIPEVRSAGYLYLVVAHIGAIAILLCFGVLQANTGDYSFANMRAQSLTPFWGSVAFLLALFGFGAKAGLLPLHVWLPEAHPAAPSPVSALMSAVMLKMAIYGLLRVVVRPAAGRSSGGGARCCWRSAWRRPCSASSSPSVQVDMKRLLAYSSIENMGLLFAGMGLTLIFSAYGMGPMAALALTATLYHVASHACLQEPALPRHRQRAARHRRAQPRPSGRADPHHALARLGDAGRRARQRRPAAAVAASSPNGCCCRASSSRPACPTRCSTC